ncbi:hypothetical protein EHYA_07675 [Embleya hyalina]|uniref:Uncharacterized protein n=1 Tax=Embleya hyalina TaxID=516124 RepID=A0A401YZD4_9ACTN|nr:hypothetical protein EHYA_07675 [Embleya hyalina]
MDRASWRRLGRGWGPEPDLGGWLWAPDFGDLRFCVVGVESRASSAGFVHSDAFNAGVKTKTARSQPTSGTATPQRPARRPKAPSRSRNRIPRRPKQPHTYPDLCFCLTPRQQHPTRSGFCEPPSPTRPPHPEATPPTREGPPADSTRPPSLPAAAGPVFADQHARLARSFGPPSPERRRSTPRPGPAPADSQPRAQRTPETTRPTREGPRQTRSGRPPCPPLPGWFSPTNAPVSSGAPGLGAPNAGGGPPHDPDRPAPAGPQP